MNNKDKEIADKLDNLVSCIAKGSVSIAALRDSISYIRYAIARLRTNAENDMVLMTEMERVIEKMKKKDLGAYANYDKCIPCVFMSFHGCTHPYRDEIGDVNGCVYFADAQKERDNE